MEADEITVGSVVVSLEVATVEHARALARDMRMADREECIATGYVSGEDALLASMEHSALSIAVLFGGRVAAVCGVVPVEGDTVLGSDTGNVWALTGRLVDRHKRAFLSASRACLVMLLRVRPTLVALVDGRYAAALRWLRWLGFRVGEPEPYGPYAIPFHPAVLRSPTWAR